MIFPLVPVRCIPSDFINPFSPLYVTTATCSGLLLLQVLALFLISKSTLATFQRRWQNWAKPMPLLLLVSAGATLGAGGLTVWIWLQSRSFIPWCAGFVINLSGQAAAYHTAEDGVQITVKATACLLLAGLIAVLLMRWQRRGPRTSASTTG